MKKLFLLLTAGVIALSSCKQEPMLTLSTTSVTPAAAGQVIMIDVTSNCSWKATCADETIVISPAQGIEGSTPVSVTVPENPVSTPRNFTVTFTGTNEVGVISTGLEIAQQSAAAAVGVALAEGTTLTGYAQTLKATLNASNDWSVTAPEGVTVEPASGTYGQYELTVTIPENTTTEAKKFDLTFALGGDAASQTLTLDQPVISSVELGGVSYKVKWMADGRLWMVENLRYVPEGKAPSADPSDNSGIWYPNYLTAEAKTAADSVAKYGLLYNFKAIYGVDPTTEENVKSVEGAQGICPDGWHIPTKDEADSLVKAYWNDEQEGAGLVELEAGGFNPVFGGYVQVNTSTAKGTYGKVLRGYVMTSTFASFKDDGTKISSFNKGLMITVTAKYQRVNIANGSNFSGAAVRCVKNK